MIEQRLGHNLPSNFPTIDRFDANGIATSIKSIDLRAPSYTNLERVVAVGKRFVDVVAEFSRKQWAGTNIRSHQIRGRALDLAIPPNPTEAQRRAGTLLIRSFPIPETTPYQRAQVLGSASKKGASTSKSWKSTDETHNGVQTKKLLVSAS